MNIVEADKIINDFLSCIDVRLSPTHIRRGSYKEIREDFDYNVIYPVKFRDVNFTDEQRKSIEELSPVLAPLLIYCSAIELLARVCKIGAPPSRLNHRYFKWSAKNLFKLTYSAAEHLWKIRNSLSHSYSIKDYTVSRTGYKIALYVPRGKRGWVFCARPMRKSLENAGNEASTLIAAYPESKRIKIAILIQDSYHQIKLLPNF